MAVLKSDSPLPPLPGGVLPPAPTVGLDAPNQPSPDESRPTEGITVEDTPPGIEAHRAQEIIDDPAAVLGVGPVAPKKRKIASRWDKAKYVIRPTVVDPLKVGVYGTAGFIAVGAVYGAATSATVGAGMIGGFVVGSFVLPPAVAVVAAVGVLRSFSRLFTSREALTDRIEKRRQNALLKEHGIVSRKQIQKRKRRFRS